MKLRHCYPLNHRPSKVFERKSYYGGLNVGQIEEWFRTKPEKLRKPIFHVDPGSETGYIRNKYREKRGRLLFFGISSFEELKAMALEYLPEDIYYDRNVYRDHGTCADCGRRGDGCRSCSEVEGQELMFDIDPENIDCPNCGTLEDRVKGRSMFKFCYICFNTAIDHTVRLHAWLGSRGYRKLSLVYSGRGFHIYVGDKAGYVMTFEERRELAEKVMNEGFGIDAWVTDGEARLARVPFTLNGLVSRICRPLEVTEIKNEDFWRSPRYVPNFV